MKNHLPQIRLAVVYAFYVIVLSQLQVTLPDEVRILGARPDLTLVLVILSGYLFGRMDGAVIGLFAGFMRDLFAGRALGLGMLLLMYAGLLAAYTFRETFRRNLALSLVQVLWLTALYQLVITGIVYLVPMLPDVPLPAGPLFQAMLRDLPAQALANVVAALPIGLLLRYVGPYKRQETLRPRRRVRTVRS